MEHAYYKVWECDGRLPTRVIGIFDNDTEATAFAERKNREYRLKNWNATARVSKCYNDPPIVRRKSAEKAFAEAILE